MQMRFAGSFFAPIFRHSEEIQLAGTPCSSPLHSFPEGFRSGRHRKGAEMNQKNTEIDTSTMGGRIRALRLQKGWSQEELGFRIGVNKKSVISEYENDKRAVTLAMLPILTEALGSTMDYLVTGQAAEEDPNVALAIQLLKDLKTEKGRKAAIEHIRIVAMMEQ